MSEIYRKRGWSVRWENGVVVRAVESGVAVDDGEVFRCFPDARAAALLPHSMSVDRILEVVKPHVIERLIVAEGEAEHDCDGRQWRERSQRLHLSILRNGHRILIDQADFSLQTIERIFGVRWHRHRPLPGKLRLAPNVAAALASLIATDQRPGGIDGKGLPILERPGSNWYRPSYRVRPVRVPMHLELRHDNAEIEDAPRAIALLAPPHGPTLQVLIDDGESAWPAVIPVRMPRSVARDVTFYPYGAGSFGAEMML